MTEKELKAFDEYDYPFLDEPVPVTEQSWPDDVPPLVSVSCKTYMHENFIRDAIEGFIMQKTTFRIEVLIHDDASTDKTADIVREYEAKHPNLIKTTYQIENQYKKKPKTDKFVKPHPRRGKYVAPCEGDDYWTDPMKLQKQAMFMENNPGYSLCYHKFKRKKNSTFSKSSPVKGKDFTSFELIGSPSGIAMCTKFYINVFNDRNIPREEIMTGDYAFNAYLGTHGGAKFIADIKPSVRRIHPGGVYSSRSDLGKLKAGLNGKIKVYNYFKSNKNEEYTKITIMSIYNKIAESIYLTENKNAYQPKGVFRFKLFKIKFEINLAHYLPFLRRLRSKI